MLTVPHLPRFAGRPLRAVAAQAPERQRLAVRWWEEPNWESPSDPDLPTIDGAELVESLFGTAIADPFSRIGSALRWVTRPQWDDGATSGFTLDIDDTTRVPARGAGHPDVGRVS